MDVKIENNDISVLSNGSTKMVYGDDEIIQRVKICCKIPKGAFIYNKPLGTDFSSIDENDERALKKTEMLLNEAVMSISGIKLELVSMEKTDKTTTLNLKVLYNGKELETEVVI